jgi:hypothetical protein
MILKNQLFTINLLGYFCFRIIFLAALAKPKIPTPKISRPVGSEMKIAGFVIEMPEAKALALSKCGAAKLMIAAERINNKPMV